MSGSGSLQARVLERLARKAAEQQHAELQQAGVGPFYAEPAPPMLPPRRPKQGERRSRQQGTAAASSRVPQEAPPPRRLGKERATAARPAVTAASKAWRQEIGGFDSSSSSSEALTPESDDLSDSEEDLELEMGRPRRKRVGEAPASGCRTAGGDRGAAMGRGRKAGAERKRGRDIEREPGDSDFDSPAKKTAGGRDLIAMGKALIQGRLCSKRDFRTLLGVFVDDGRPCAWFLLQYWVSMWQGSYSLQRRRGIFPRCHRNLPGHTRTSRSCGTRCGKS